VSADAVPSETGWPEMRSAAAGIGTAAAGPGELPFPVTEPPQQTSAATAAVASDVGSSADRTVITDSVAKAPTASVHTSSDSSLSAVSYDWAPVGVNERPGGNVYEVTDAFSAPPMPSESVTSAPPTFAFPRPVDTLRPTPAPQQAAPPKIVPKTSTEASPKTAAPKAAARKTTAPKTTAPKAAVRRGSGRQAHLTIARVEPWSVMKFSFAVSVVAFIVLFIAVAVLYGMLSALGVFTSLQHLVSNVTSSQNQAGYNASKWFSASKILGYTVMLGGVNVVLITAISTIGAVVYNLTSRLIGGVEVTLRETE
jgi:hypothetical protein